MHNIYYPINLMLKNRTCVVIGGGKVAERKIKSLLKCHAKVKVISPVLTQPLQELVRSKKIIHVPRKYRKGDLKGSFLVIGATNCEHTNCRIVEEAKTYALLFNIVDQPELGNFIVPSVVRRGNLTLSVSTCGISPALSKQLRIQLQHQFGYEYTQLLKLLAKLRPIVYRRYPNNSVKRTKIFERIISSDILELLRQGKKTQVKEIIDKCI